jgi:putative flippase GtrA
MNILNNQKLRELLTYGIVGGISTLLNILLYAFFSKICQLYYLASTVIAFILATLFAYFGNKYIVFHSNKKALIVEMFMFFGLRLLMGGLDFLFMYITVGILTLNDMIMKIFSNCVVIIGNYICSKLLIFRGQPEDK